MASTELRKISREFAEFFGELSDRMVPAIMRGLQAGFSPAVAVANAAAEVGLDAALTNRILDDMVRSTSVGMAITAPVAITSLQGLSLRLSYLNEFYPGDELNLSSRIAGNRLQRVIGQEIERHLASSRQFGNAASTWRETAEAIQNARGPAREQIQGELNQASRDLVRTATRAAEGDKAALRDLQVAVKRLQKSVDKMGLNGAPNQSLRVAYQGVIDAARRLDAAGLQASVDNAVRQKARYNAERIARTEMARAYSTAFHSDAAINEDVIGVRWVLSSRHASLPVDICDVHAKVDHYGMGPGVYPKDQVPAHPSHANCLCGFVTIFHGETEIGAFDPRKGSKWLQAQSEHDRVLMLGRAGYRKTKDWQEYLKNWNGHGAPTVYREAARVIREIRQAQLFPTAPNRE